MGPDAAKSVWNLANVCGPRGAFVVCKTAPRTGDCIADSGPVCTTGILCTLGNCNHILFSASARPPTAPRDDCAKLSIWSLFPSTLGEIVLPTVSRRFSVYHLQCLEPPPMRQHNEFNDTA